MAGKKPVVLELGGNAACIVDEDADIDDAVNRLIVGAFYQSGQSCIGVQRIIAHESIYNSLRDKLVAATKKLIAGDPKDESTFIGPNDLRIRSTPARTDGSSRRSNPEVRFFAEANATERCSTRHSLRTFPKTKTSASKKHSAPSRCLASSSHSTTHSRKSTIASSAYRPASSLETSTRCSKPGTSLDVGGVVIGDVPSWRVDNMPYGGVKRQRTRPRRHPICHGRHGRDPKSRHPDAAIVLHRNRQCVCKQANRHRAPITSIAAFPKLYAPAFRRA